MHVHILCESFAKFLEVCHDLALMWCDVADAEGANIPARMQVMEIEEVNLTNQNRCEKKRMLVRKPVITHPTYQPDSAHHTQQ